MYMLSITVTIVLSDTPKNYLIFQQVTEDSILSGRPMLSEKDNRTEILKP